MSMQKNIEFNYSISQNTRRWESLLLLCLCLPRADRVSSDTPKYILNLGNVSNRIRWAE